MFALIRLAHQCLLYLAAKQRIKEIEEGLKREFIETIRQSLERLVTIQPQRQIAIRELDKSIKTKLTIIMADKIVDEAFLNSNFKFRCNLLY